MLIILYQYRVFFSLTVEALYVWNQRRRQSSSVVRQLNFELISVRLLSALQRDEQEWVISLYEMDVPIPSLYRPPPTEFTERPVITPIVYTSSGEIRARKTNLPVNPLMLHRCTPEYALLLLIKTHLRVWLLFSLLWNSR